MALIAAKLDTELADLPLPPAVIAGVARLFRITRPEHGAVRVSHLVQCNVVELMSMKMVGYAKVEQTRRVLADMGLTLALDPDLPESPAPVTADTLADERKRLRIAARRIRRLADEIVQGLSDADVDDADVKMAVSR